MKGKLIASSLMFLVIGIGVGYAFSYEEISELQSEVTSLESDYDNLNGTYNQLLNDCDFLQSEHSLLQNDYDFLNSSYYGLQEAYGLLNENYNSLNSAYGELQGVHEEALDRIAELEQLVEYEVYVLLDKEYYQSIKNDLENANETIMVAMYSMIYDPDDTFDRANDLIRELVYAKDRGVNVTVVIEYRTYEANRTANLEAYNYLSANNVTVHLDEDTDTDHMKLVIIDNIVYVGSHNWSESGLYYNSETSIKIVSEDIAEIYRTYFETI